VAVAIITLALVLSFGVNVTYGPLCLRTSLASVEFRPTGRRQPLFPTTSPLTSRTSARRARLSL